MFIAGAIATFFSKEAVLRHLGPKANKVEAYGVASVSGTVLAVCSCSVLPMFAGIYAMGAGLGPASAFLYSGPAINVMAIFLSARVLGLDLGVWHLGDPPDLDLQDTVTGTLTVGRPLGRLWSASASRISFSLSGCTSQKVSVKSNGVWLTAQKFA